MTQLHLTVHASRFKDDPAPFNDTLRQIQEHALCQTEEQHQAEVARTQRLAAEELADFQRVAEEQVAEQDARAALLQGIQPVEFPTKEPVQSAKRQIRYDPTKLHSAICGASGSGKSSLVNAFRGLPGSHSNAAAVGVTETTSEIGHHLCGRSKAVLDPRKRMRICSRD